MESMGLFILYAAFCWWMRDRMTKLEKRIDKLENKAPGIENRPSAF